MYGTGTGAAAVVALSTPPTPTHPPHNPLPLHTLVLSHVPILNMYWDMEHPPKTGRE